MTRMERFVAHQAPQKATRRMGIQQALEWAFGKECASLDLGTVDPENPDRPAVGSE